MHMQFVQIAMNLQNRNKISLSSSLLTKRNLDYYMVSDLPKAS